ncbi:calcium-binding protein [Microvirga sp. VF16]|uniref:calcium-binding protein n=1 Tax=Microvirga sp. VF16 TaxID=2807101 RepID=UPI00193E624B|nr:M10 family metallopeptidase C-terminal domain-containing protein [Microvirga sp. VF16]QRM31358.1 M10 family metallopeptidase C-terminal domain-containing protein [Microvirga sp. VF16]
MELGKRYSPGQDTELHLPDAADESGDGGGVATPYSPDQDTDLDLPDTSDEAEDGEGVADPYSPDQDTDRQSPDMVIRGGEDRDFLEGGEGIDHLWGEGGNDVLYGEQGDDHLNGGAGHDLLVGDLGADQLTGGEGQDQFWFWSDAVAESPATTTGADQILDFQYGTDKIGLGVAGTAENYHSAGTTATSMDAAAQEANQTGEDRLTYLYLANEGADTGYLLADLDGNGSFEFGITMVGNGGPGEFGYDAIEDVSL